MAVGHILVAAGSSGLAVREAAWSGEGDVVACLADVVVAYAVGFGQACPSVPGKGMKVEDLAVAAMDDVERVGSVEAPLEYAESAPMESGVSCLKV